MEKKINNLEKKLNNMRNSNSWKLTAPLRKVSSFFKQNSR